MPSLAPLALTMGDPAGIGPDITLAAWRARTERALPAFVVYADANILQARATALGFSVPIQVVASPERAAAAFRDALPVIQVGNAFQITPGVPSSANAPITLAAIDQAAAAVMEGQARALVTNPIAKSVLYEAGFRHPGHTEYLAHLAQRHSGLVAPVVPVMMLVASELKVVPATIHIPLADVPRVLTADLLRRTIEIAISSLQRDFAIAQPRIAVAGLNPHAGENGTIGREDQDLIAPVIVKLREQGFHVTGPHSADTLFHPAARARYDAVVAMYHDQALIPIKTLAFDRGVNVTLGLPFVRTSPDHGTAFNIAGTGTASAESLIQALLLADQMASARAANARHPAP